MSDDWFDDVDVEEPAVAAASEEQQPLPVGEHVLEVKKVIDHGVKLEIHLAPTDRRYRWVFCHLRKEIDFAKKLAKQFRQAVGVQDLTAAIEMQDLDGKQVVARIYHKGDYVNVGGFRAAEQPEAVEPKPRRSAAAKANAVAKEAAPDDIPF